MNRAEFMEKLRILLSDIEESEREEALAFYEHYFDDAGAENEQAVIDSLGSPEKVANTIKEGLGEAAVEQGELKQGKKSGNGKLILLLILAVFALPVLGPVLLGLVSMLFGIVAAVVAALFAAAIVGIALLVAGASIFALAIGKLFLVPVVGVILLGVSLLLIGIGILAMVLGIWIISKVIPAIIRFIVNNVRKLLKKKEE